MQLRPLEMGSMPVGYNRLYPLRHLATLITLLVTYWSHSPLMGLTARITAISTNNITLDSSQINANDILIVHDCQQPVLLLANTGGASVTYASSTILAPFPIGTVVSRYQPTIYYLGRLTNGRPALYEKNHQ